MHIGRAHKNRYLHTVITKIFFVNHFFYYHNLSISRTNNLVMRNREISFWRTEKRNYKNKYYQRYKKNNPGNIRYRCAEEKEKNNIDNAKEQRTDCNGFIAFFVNIHPQYLNSKYKNRGWKNLFYFIGCMKRK